MVTLFILLSKTCTLSSIFSCLSHRTSSMTSLRFLHGFWKTFCKTFTGVCLSSVQRLCSSSGRNQQSFWYVHVFCKRSTSVPLGASLSSRRQYVPSVVNRGIGQMMFSKIFQKILSLSWSCLSRLCTLLAEQGKLFQLSSNFLRHYWRYHVCSLPTFGSTTGICDRTSRLPYAKEIHYRWLDLVRDPLKASISDSDSGNVEEALSMIKFWSWSLPTTALQRRANFGFIAIPARIILFLIQLQTRMQTVLYRVLNRAFHQFRPEGRV